MLPSGVINLGGIQMILTGTQVISFHVLHISSSGTVIAVVEKRIPVPVLKKLTCFIIEISQDMLWRNRITSVHHSLRNMVR